MRFTISGTRRGQETTAGRGGYGQETGDAAYRTKILAFRRQGEWGEETRRLPRSASPMDGLPIPTGTDTVSGTMIAKPGANR